MPTLSIILLAMTTCLLSACARPRALPRTGSLAQPRDALELRSAIAYATPSLGTKRTPVADRQTSAERDASDVLNAMNDDLLACFARGGGAREEAHIIAEIVVGRDGVVRNVVTTGGMHVRPKAMRCFERRIARAKFMPPYTEGTARLTVPFSFVLESR